MVYVNSIDELLYAAMKVVEKEDNMVTCVLRHEDMQDAMEYLFGELNLDVAYIEYSPNDDEYSAICIDTDYTVGIEPIWRAGKYLKFCESILVVDEDVPCQFQLAQENEEIIVFSLNDDECETDDESKCELDFTNDIQTSESSYISKDGDGMIRGFSKAWSENLEGTQNYSSYSFYCDNEDKVKEVAEKFGLRL